MLFERRLRTVAGYALSDNCCILSVQSRHCLGTLLNLSISGHYPHTVYCLDTVDTLSRYCLSTVKHFSHTICKAQTLFAHYLITFWQFYTAPSAHCSSAHCLLCEHSKKLFALAHSLYIIYSLSTHCLNVIFTDQTLFARRLLVSGYQYALFIQYIHCFSLSQHCIQFRHRLYTEYKLFAGYSHCLRGVYAPCISYRHCLYTVHALFAHYLQSLDIVCAMSTCIQVPVDNVNIVWALLFSASALYTIQTLFIYCANCARIVYNLDTWTVKLFSPLYAHTYTVYTL